MEVYNNICKLPVISGSHQDYVVLLRTGDFDSEAIDGGAGSILDGGGNLRIYGGPNGTNRLSIQIINFVTGVTPNIWAFVKVPVAQTDALLFMQADPFETTQPADDALFGSESVWKDNFGFIYHANESGTDGVFKDSTGNNPLSSLSTGASLPTVTTNHPFGGTWPDFDTSQGVTLLGTAQSLNGGALAISAWINIDSSTSDKGVIGNRYPDDKEWISQRAKNKTELKGQTLEDQIDEDLISTGVNHLIISVHDSVSMIQYLDGFVEGTDVTIQNPSGINTPIGNDYRVGTRNDNNLSNRLDGRTCEWRGPKFKPSPSYVATDTDNQTAINGWLIVGKWAKRTVITQAVFSDLNDIGQSVEVNMGNQ